MSEWNRYIQTVAGYIDRCIREEDEAGLTLAALADRLGYSEYHTSHRFSELSGMTLKDYIRLRKLSFALKDLRDTKASILSVALKYGFSSHEAFTRAFRDAFGRTPSEYRMNPVPVALRTVIRPFDCYLMEGAMKNMKQTDGSVKTYFVKMPAHRFLHIRNYESIGYWDFWQKQAAIPGQDCETICGLLHSIAGKLDDVGGETASAASGQLMAWINAPEGRVCSWGIPLAEAYGVRLSADWNGEVPANMRVMDVPEGEYIVFEHGPFDFETESRSVEAKIEAAMKDFDWEASGYALDLTPERVFYFYHDCERFFRYVRPVVRKEA